MSSPEYANAVVDIQNVVVGDRARKDLGDVESMMNSIKEFGIIQPIVLGSKLELIAGGRRLEALRRLGVTELEHGVHWVFRDESTDTEEKRLRFKSMELEENLRRKEMNWPEVVAAKKQLLEIMEKIHGPQVIGGLTRDAKRTGQTEGFGVRKLAAMLGESPATVSQDLKLAAVVEHMPQLKTIQSKNVASQQAISMIIAAGIKAGKITADPKLMQAANPNQQVTQALQYRVMIHCKDEAEQAALLQEMADRGFKVEAIIV